MVVPASIPADCSRDVEAELTAFFREVPDDSAITFPADGCYAQGNRIEIRDKAGLVIDGRGSSFRSTAENTGRRANPNWLLLRVRNLRITNMNVVGNFHLTGKRSQQRVNQASTEGEAGATTQPNAGVSVYGGDTVYITDMDIRDTFGDGVLTGMSEYVDHLGPLETPRNVHVERVTASKAARHCFSPNQVIGFWLEDSSGRDCWYGALDAELDSFTQQLQNVHILRNTFSDFNMLGIYFPVAGDGVNTRDIEIRGNRMLTRADAICNDLILVGAYPSNPRTFQNVVVEDNSFAVRSGLAVHFDHVSGGSVRRNRVKKYVEAGCRYPARTPFAYVTNAVRTAHP